MPRSVSVLRLFLLAFISVGCGEDTGGVKMAKVQGTVTLQGAPLAGAQLMVIPEKGPLAMGTTDTAGKFSLTTGSIRGVAVGKIRIAVTVADPDAQSLSPPTPSGGTFDPNAAMKQMAGSANAEWEKKKKKQAGEGAKSGLPSKYSNVATSGLSYDIAPGGNSDLKVELK